MLFKEFYQNRGGLQYFPPISISKSDPQTERQDPLILPDIRAALVGSQPSLEASKFLS